MTRTTQNDDFEQAALASVLSEVHAASATHASKLGGGSLFAQADRQPEEIERDLSGWYPNLTSSIKRFSGLETISLASQVGPLDTGYITFGGGVPVGGYSQLTLFQSGHFNFNGHFHVSGAPSYNVAYAVGVRSQRGVLYTLLVSGHLAGTFEPGSRDFDWSKQELREVVREDWGNIAVNSTWWWNARVNFDPLGVLETVKTLAGTVGAVASVVALL
jgi:hypothetical protein